MLAFNFIRSFVFMRYLDFESLGFITILNTFIAMLSMFQLGLLNGGYRIYSLGKENDNKKVNNTIFSYILLLSVVSFCVITLLDIFNIGIFNDYWVLLLGILGGMLNLSKNWLRNVYIAIAKLKQLNKLEFFTNFTVLFGLILIPFLGFKGAVIVILLQPFLFVLYTFSFNKNLRPTNYLFNLKTLKWILTFGFVPFLIGIFSQINIQIQTWSIVNFLSTEKLGQFYLASMFANVFMLAPISVNNLFFPPAVRAFAENRILDFKKILRNYSIFIVIYSILVFILLFTVIKPIVGILFPKHLIGVKYVYYMFPGLVFLIMLHPITLIYNSAVYFKPMFWGYFTSIIIFTCLLFFGYTENNFSLTWVAISTSLTAFYIFIFLSIGYFFNKSKIYQIKE